jgi:hypothetical protein
MSTLYRRALDQKSGVAISSASASSSSRHLIIPPRSCTELLILQVCSFGSFHAEKPLKDGARRFARVQQNKQ